VTVGGTVTVGRHDLVRQLGGSARLDRVVRAGGTYWNLF
jgi:hypothetical protein